MEFDRWAIRHFAQPHIQILTFPRFEEKNVVAVVELSQLIELAQSGL
jgi:hypothetical protein